MALSDAYVEVIADPASYQMNMVFRESQDDGVTPYLTLTAPAVVNPTPLPGDPSVLFSFAATPTETQALPDWDIVSYTELVFTGVSAPPADFIRRMFNSEVSVND